MTEDRYTDDIGAYLLDALEPGEKAAFERHLAGCEACREQVARLEVARDALPRAVDQVEPPERLKQSLMETVWGEAAQAEPGSREAAVSGERRRSRWRELFLARPAFAAAAAALLVAIGIGVGALVGAAGGGGGDSSTVAATVDVTRIPGATASLAVPEDADQNGGAVLRVNGMKQPGPGQVYEVWVKRGDKLSPSSLFNVKTDGSGAAAVPEGLHDVDALLVTREPARGSTTPSEPPVVTVPLSS